MMLERLIGLTNRLWWWCDRHDLSWLQDRAADVRDALVRIEPRWCGAPKRRAR
jgi:hypothetical protein